MYKLYGVVQALDLQSEDKSCLVARSKCYLQLGEASLALEDAEASLKEDKKYHRVSTPCPYNFLQQLLLLLSRVYYAFIGSVPEG